MSKTKNEKWLSQNAVSLSVDNTSPTNTTVWTDENTSFMLNCFHNYSKQIGPMKKFQNKKTMWTKVRQDMIKELGCSFTETQIENRYKTVLRRNISLMKKKNTTGPSPNLSSVHEEFSQITALDDSIEPSVSVGTSSSGLKRITKDVPQDEPQVTKKVKTSLNDLMITLNKEKEEDRLKRKLKRQKCHEQKMNILKKIFNNK
ncbi:uncharacterized protein LOC113558791 [Rhopalosiphum maidis]|uniref:uncharacterized protein LOC113555873 n=1 Tax=Rhopalosiphum maidis TaxID=43146 RepID=UPI000EFDF1A6|nr:uncharacterized protein LOC113555873 [Rhopalosiphum maidis]XP_026820136.1 uncharacterized protein LOC113558791 [Rhopalosiphum maidis]